MTELEQLRIDLQHLAQRQKVIEDAIINLEDGLVDFFDSTREWSEYLSKLVFKQEGTIFKNKKAFEWFKSSLSETHKQTFEKFESLFAIIKGKPQDSF